MDILEMPWVLVTTGMMFIAGILYIGMNSDHLIAWWKKRNTSRAHGPWCVTVTRPPFGTQIIYRATARGACVRWRNRNRQDFSGPVAILSRDEVDKRNADLLASEEYWRLMYALAPYVDEARQRAEVVPSSIYTTPITTILTVPAIAQARWMEHIDGLIDDAQLLSDSIRTLKRRLEIPNE